MFIFKYLAVPLLLAGARGAAVVVDGDTPVDDVLEQGAKQFGRNAPSVAANKSDVKYIKCQVCKLAAAEAFAAHGRLQKEHGKKLREIHLITHVEQMCDPEKDAGEWLNRLDLQEQGAALVVVDMKKIGDCGVECRTAAKACELALGDSDTDLAEYVMSKSPTSAQLETWLCNGDGGNACARPAPPVPEDRPTGPAFVALSEEELQLRSTTRSMAQQDAQPEAPPADWKEALQRHAKTAQDRATEYYGKARAWVDEQTTQLQENDSVKEYVAKGKVYWGKALKWAKENGAVLGEKLQGLSQQALQKVKEFQQKGTDKSGDSSGEKTEL